MKIDDDVIEQAYKKLECSTHKKLECLTREEWKSNVERLADEAYAYVELAIALSQWGRKHRGFEDEALDWNLSAGWVFVEDYYPGPGGSDDAYEDINKQLSCSLMVG